MLNYVAVVHDQVTAYELIEREEEEAGNVEEESLFLPWMTAAWHHFVWSNPDLSETLPLPFHSSASSSSLVVARLPTVLVFCNNLHHHHFASLHYLSFGHEFIWLKVTFLWHSSIDSFDASLLFSEVHKIQCSPDLWTHTALKGGGRRRKLE